MDYNRRTIAVLALLYLSTAMALTVACHDAGYSIAFAWVCFINLLVAIRFGWAHLEDIEALRVYVAGRLRGITE